MDNEGRHYTLISFQFPNYWEEIREPVVSVDDALARMRQIESSFEAQEGEHVSVCIEDPRGDSIHVGLAGEMWMITHIHHVAPYDCEYQYAVGDMQAEGTVVFLYPAWTEVSKQLLIPKTKGEEVVRQWIVSGTLSSCVEWTYEYL